MDLCLRLTNCFQLKSTQCRYKCSMMTLRLQIPSVQKWNSFLANIHLRALFHAQDLKRYGFSKILALVVRDIKVLEKDGIEIPLYGGHVRSGVVQVTGDNLSLHSLFGLVESFSARY